MEDCAATLNDSKGSVAYPRNIFPTITIITALFGLIFRVSRSHNLQSCTIHYFCPTIGMKKWFGYSSVASLIFTGVGFLVQYK